MPFTSEAECNFPTFEEALNAGTLAMAAFRDAWKSVQLCMIPTAVYLKQCSPKLHCPDPKQLLELQYKQMVTILPRGLYDEWLDASSGLSMYFMRMFPADRLTADAYSKALPPAPAAYALCVKDEARRICGPCTALSKICDIIR